MKLCCWKANLTKMGSCPRHDLMTTKSTETATLFADLWADARPYGQKLIDG